MNESLNLPALPRHHFWRLVETSFHMDELQLRRRIGFLSVKLDDAIILFYKTVGGARVGAYEPKAAIEDAARCLPRVPYTAIPAGMSLDRFEASFDKVYESYRGSYPGVSVQAPGAGCSPAAAVPGR